MGKRQMPKAGFYVSPPVNGIDINGNTYRLDGFIYYTTGVQGGGGHKYIRFDLGGSKVVPRDHNKWHTLLWTCVPGKKYMDQFLYAENIEHAIDLYNTFVLQYVSPGYVFDKKLVRMNHDLKIQLESE